MNVTTYIFRKQVAAMNLAKNIDMSQKDTWIDKQNSQLGV